MRPSFDVAGFHVERSARGITLGAPLVAVASTGSTNDDALAAARAGAPSGSGWVADEQTAGRGRRGNRWTSPPGENLTASLLLRPRAPLQRVAALPLVVGLAVREAAARRLATPVAVKWPNDVVVGARKLAGVLVESQLSGNDVAAVVVGIGVNVATTHLPAELAGIATSLRLEGATATREDVLLDVLEALERRLPLYLDRGVAAFAAELRAHDALRDRPVSAGGHDGVARGIDEEGALLVEAEGRLQRVITGVAVAR